MIRLRFFEKPENGFVGVFTFPIIQRKLKMKEMYLTTPFREKRLSQFGGPAVVLVSAWQPSSHFKSSELYTVQAEKGGGVFLERCSRSSACWSVKREKVCEGRLHSVCVGSLSSLWWSSSSEMSVRPRSNSEIVSREGGMDESEDEEEKERGNMKID